jgi:hypothetical protein
MSLSFTIFLAICVLGCDALIYFLYEWAYGESKRIRKRRPASRLKQNASAEWSAADGGVDSNLPARAGNKVIVIEPRRATNSASLHRDQERAERHAYPRLAASFGSLKPRT